MLTSGAVTALTANRDTLRTLTRSLTTEATTTATMLVSSEVRGLTEHAASTFSEKLDTQRNRFAQAFDGVSERFFASGEAHAVSSAHRIKSEFLSKETIQFTSKLRDSLTGKPVQNNVRALVGVAFQEFRRQQDSTLKALESRSNTWQTRLQNLAAPVLAVIGGAVILALIILAIIRFILFLRHNRKKHHENN